jgi:hypothetical protein
MPETQVKHEALTAALSLKMILENDHVIEAPLTCWVAAITDMMTPAQIGELVRRVEERKKDVSAVLISGLTGNRLC